MSTSVYSPQITQETALGLERFDMRDEMLACRELELCGPVDAESVADIIRGLRHLQKADPATPITLFINSPGVGYALRGIFCETQQMHTREKQPLRSNRDAFRGVM